MDANPKWFVDANQPHRTNSIRWAAFGPYYAMFPVTFARSVIAEYTQIGDGVLDPFAGRGTSIFCAREADRKAFGVEINPLGWIYGRTKLSPAPFKQVIGRIEELGIASTDFLHYSEQLPLFFHHCFSMEVRSFLLASRQSLRWRTSRVDRTAMAFILTYLHGKIERGRPSALSNQMRQTKAMAPDYSIKWWIKNGLAEPPQVDPVSFLGDRIAWRYAKGVPDWGDEALRLGDCRDVLPRCRGKDAVRYRLLLTSPPYRGITSYYYDQWLRFWLLGEAERPISDGLRWKTKFENARDYETLLKHSFKSCRRILTEDAVVYIRTDARPETLDITKRVLKNIFPNKRHDYVPAPYNKATQTHLFGDRTEKPGEMDIILTP